MADEGTLSIFVLNTPYTRSRGNIRTDFYRDGDYGTQSFPADKNETHFLISVEQLEAYLERGLGMICPFYLAVKSGERAPIITASIEGFELAAGTWQPIEPRAREGGKTVSVKQQAEGLALLLSRYRDETEATLQAVLGAQAKEQREEVGMSALFG